MPQSHSLFSFPQIIKYLAQPIENLILLKGDYFGNRCEAGFELLEGKVPKSELSAAILMPVMMKIDFKRIL
jgi:hypothetical protein